MRRNLETRRACKLLSMVLASQVLSNAVHMGGMGACRFERQTGAASSKKAAFTAARSYPASCRAIAG